MAHGPTEGGLLQQEVAVQRLVEALGVALTSAAEGGLAGRCPFHDGDGLRVDPGANRWSCGTCNLTGGPIEWVQQAHAVSRRHAVELLVDGGALQPVKRRGGRPKVKPGPSQSTVRRLQSPVDSATNDAGLLTQVIAYYHQTLKQSPEAIGFLESRGLNSPEVIDTFKLGFSNRTLGYRLPMKNRQAGAEIRSRLQKLGILRDTGHEHLRGSLVIPVFDEHGHVVQVAGRKVTPGLRPGTQLHVCLPGPRRGLWNLAALGVTPAVILCQSPIDGLSIWCAGFRNVVAVLGTDAFGDEHAAAFRSRRVQRALIAFRRDAAGDQAAEAVAERLMSAGVTCYRVRFPAGLDANDFTLKHAPATKALGVVLRNATWMGKGQAPAEDLESELIPVKEQAPAAESRQPPPASQRIWAERPAFRPRSAPASESERPEEIAVPASEPPPPVPEPARDADGQVTFEAQAPKPPEVPTEVREEEVVIQLGDRRYRVRGLARNMSYESLKVNLLASRAGLETGFHVDTLELYAAKQRAAFVKQAALELGVHDDVIKQDLGKVLLRLEALQEVQIREALRPKDTEIKLDEAERSAAMGLLTDPRLLDRVLLDFERCGVVGEETNKLVGYLAAVSRKLEDPLAVLVQSSSAAGKTSLMDAVLAFVPDEDRVQYSAMTGQSLFYMGDSNVRHKVLAIAEEEGAERASYALKLLQSEGRLTIASTGKDPTTGRLVTQEYRVEGPVQLFLTTTAIDIDEELLNRCLVLTVDEDRRQTQAIHQLQRERQTLEGLLARSQRTAILKVHQDAQRLLRPLSVVNPYARHLTFLDDRTRTRRDHLKYLTLIRAVALLHQYQRPVKSIQQGGRTLQYVEVTPADIAVANRLAHQVLGRSLDELPPQTRRLLVLIDAHVRQECERQQLRRQDLRFTRRQLRDLLGWGQTQLKVHLQRLVELEYAVVHRTGPASSHCYELLYDGQGQDGTAFLQGLLDVEQLQRQHYDGDRPGPGEAQSGAGRAPVGAESAGGRVQVPDEISSSGEELPAGEVENGEQAHPGHVFPEPSQTYPGTE